LPGKQPISNTKTNPGNADCLLSKLYFELKRVILRVTISADIKLKRREAQPKELVNEKNPHKGIDDSTDDVITGVITKGINQRTIKERSINAYAPIVLLCISFNSIFD
jgi:hypothetical protein